MLCKDVGLTISDLKMMTLGMALDYIDDYFEKKNPNKKSKTVTAEQHHFDNF